MTDVNRSRVVDLVPSAVEAPASPEPTRMIDKRSAMSRRRVLGIVSGAAVASGLGVLDLFPWSRPRGAFAAAYTEHSDCRGYFNSTSICVPSTALYTGNCSGSWHRNDGSSGTCYNFRYTHDPSSCDGHNAWRWTSGTRRKCSDGWYEYADCGGGRVSRFSICRTAI
ncbi:hypothetical protein ACQPYA_14850 [Micromonospora sp. CA-263727]|uniref:hypothetical protein n=1 Tax=Micromonospora sp. CA-263727 TaxID=3239967 RepID=UPI003D917F09